jgi:formylglycine-generating enzyme required for sulfatase activity
MNTARVEISRLWALGCLLLVMAMGQAADPVVSSVRAVQRAGTQLVEITYDVADADSATVSVSVAVSDNGGASYAVPASSFSGAVGSGVKPGANKRITWDAGTDWPGKYSANMRFKVTAQDTAPAPSGMVLIPPGSFQMGDSFGEGFSEERPVHTVTVSGFYMDRCEVTKALWDEVYGWARTHGYIFDHAGSGKGATHPVHTIGWYDMVKWCNARSEREGRVPAYYWTIAGQTTVYRTGRGGPENDWVKWNAGYRLPTEAEWEYAARGGLSGRRFPWGNTISHSRANYDSDCRTSFDVSPTCEYHPTYATGEWPYTSPVGSFGANGYGLYDMAGNVQEWCWDYWDSSAYSPTPADNPRGSADGYNRVIRGGCWFYHAWDCRSASRSHSSPVGGDCFIGFRSVLPSGQP